MVDIGTRAFRSYSKSLNFYRGFLKRHMLLYFVRIFGRVTNVICQFAKLILKRDQHSLSLKGNVPKGNQNTEELCVAYFPRAPEAKTKTGNNAKYNDQPEETEYTDK